MNNVSDFSILIVDDEKSNLEVLDHILKLSQYTVYIAKSGEAALKRAKENKPDLILLDIVMPDMDGFEVLSKLKESEITSKIPVIFITGLDSVEDEEKGLFLGAVDYITKPFHSSIVKARVETHLKIITQLRTIEGLGLIDPLTEIANRRSFDHQINVEWGRSIREKTPLSILMMDLDRFKSYNDTHGHPQGDVLLKKVSKVFVSTLKHTTDLIFRWGGEEFAVLLPCINLNGALKIADHIRANVESTVIPHSHSAQLTNITISIGIASIIPSINDSLSDFISEADKALYTAKKTGRNRVCSSQCR